MPLFWSALLLVLSGLLPSLVWILYFLRKDIHPEPKTLITKTFLMGIIISPIAVLFQYWFMDLAQRWPLLAFQAGSSGFFIWAAFIEEVVKFYAVRTIVFRNPAFDEPVDAMVYMIAAGLGFAAIENILVMFRVVGSEGVTMALQVWGLRFVGATLLHALASGLVGYFLALAWFHPKLTNRLIAIGLVFATVFHFTFNILLSFSEQLGPYMIIFILGFLVMMALLISVLFDRIKKHQKRVEQSLRLQPVGEIIAAKIKTI